MMVEKSCFMAPHEHYQVNCNEQSTFIKAKCGDFEESKRLLLQY